MAEGQPDFESTLNALERVVEKLEGGELSLEEQLNQFEAGIKLANTCQKMLENAKLRVERLTSESEDADQIKNLPF